MLLLLACAERDSEDDDSADGAVTATDDTGTGGAWTPAIGVYTEPDASISMETGWMSVTNVGDLDGDGVDELAVATQEGVVFLTVDLYRGTVRQVTVRVEGIASRAARLGNDQYALIGSLVGVYEGLPASGTVSLADAPTTIDVSPWSVAGVGDVDGDGLEDVAVAYSEDDVPLTAIFSGPLPAGALTPAVARTWVETGGVVAWGDLDGDGIGDLVGYNDLRELVVLHGPLPEGRVSMELAATAWFDLTWPLSETSVLGVVGDLDGDGRDNLALDAGTILLFDGVDRGDTVAMADMFIGDVPSYGWAEPSSEWDRGAVLATRSDADADGAPGLTLAASTGDDAYVISWYDAPPLGASLALADVVRRIERQGASGTVGLLIARLGGPNESDTVTWWTYMETLYFARAFDVPPGDDPDRDGFGAAEDCDEAAPTVHPGAAETADGRDEDCDGLVDDIAGIAQVLAEPPALVGRTGSGLGAAVAAWDDDGDGADSLVVSGELDGNGAVWIVSPGGSLADAAVRRLTSDAAALANAGDLDGDGIAELLVTSADDVLVAPGPLTGDMDAADDPRISVVDLSGSYQAAGTLTPAGDVDGDGLGDFLTGGSASDYADHRTSAVLLFAGETELRDRTLEDAWAAFAYERGQVPGRQQGQAVGDVDGDGTTDLVVGTTAGSWLFLGPLESRTYAWSEAPVSFDVRGEAVSSGDLDDDGAVEIYLAGTAVGRVFGFEGPFSAGAFAETDAAVDITATSDGFGTAMLVREDTLVVTAPWSDGPAVDGGRIYGFLAPVGTHDADDVATWMFDGAAAFDGAGSSLAELDDDGDGTRDLVAGIPWRDGTTASEGGVAFLR